MFFYQVLTFRLNFCVQIHRIFEEFVFPLNGSSDHYQENVDKVLKSHRKNANVPGFRKGHVPMGMIKKQVGVSVIVDEINKVLSESLHKFITDEDLNLLGNPLGSSIF